MKIERMCLSRRAMRDLRREAAGRVPLESGGMLLGRIENRTAYIERVTGPGPRADHTASGFLRDGEFSQRELDTAVAASAGKVDYVGEWHSHPVSVGASKKDALSMNAIATDPAYLRKTPVLIVVVLEGRRWVPRAYQWRGRLCEIPFQVGRSRKRA